MNKLHRGTMVLEVPLSKVLSTKSGSGVTWLLPEGHFLINHLL